MFSSNQSNVVTAFNYIEDVFSTYLYTGTGASQTITNGIDLSTKGGLVWIKGRSGTTGHRLTDTARGATKSLASETTAAEATETTGLTAFGTTGFTIGADADYNTSAATYVSWSLRKQPKFFDVVTYTAGSGPTSALSHNLGVVPACIIMKNTSSAESWTVVHRGTNGYTFLNATDAADGTYQPGIGSSSVSSWVGATSTTIDFSNIWGTGSNYVAYLFAHDAGGFGLTGTDNVISCGSFTTDGSGNASVTLGYEPQWILFKKSSDTGDWDILDTMRGWVVGGVDANLKPNTTQAESAGFDRLDPTATGFVSAAGVLSASQTFIYIAIRRGPMAVPTTGSSVFQPVTYTGNGTSQSVTTGITGDLTYIKYRTDAGAATFFTDRLRGSTQILESNSTAAEDTSAQHLTSFNQLGFSVGNNGNVNASGGTFISETFKRAPSVFDVVCYNGNGSSSGQTLSHNLTVLPELIFVHSRNFTNNWRVYSSSQGVAAYAALNLTSAFATDSVNPWKTPTTTTFGVGDGTYWSSLNASSYTYVAYLFSTCAGVSKVGSYTGTGALQTVNCGFTSGARFVLIKRTDSTGDWWTYDSARGISSGNDPYLFLNSTAAEVTSTNYVDTDSTGFKVTAAAPAGLNASGGTYIFLAIA